MIIFRLLLSLSRCINIYIKCGLAGFILHLNSKNYICFINVCMFLLLANEANCQFLLWHTSWFLIQILCDSIGISSSSRTSHSRVAVAALLLICRQVRGGPVQQNSLPRILQDAQQRHTLMSGTILGKESDFLQTRNTLKYFSKDQKASWQGNLNSPT